MIVARAEGGEPVIVDRLREMVQLAKGLDDKRRIVGKARARALDCLRRFGQRVRHMPADNVRAVGTNTLRSARNALDFLFEAEEALGHPIDTISGMEEARLIYLGVTQTTPLPRGRRLVLDIGGGSTELIVGEGLEPRRMESLYVGAISMSRAFFADGTIDAERWRDAVLNVRRELEPVQSEFRDLGWDRVVGTSGTIRSVAAVVRSAGWSKEGISAKSLRKLRDAMIQAGHVDGLQLDGVSARRRSVFPGGVAVLYAVVEALEIERLSPTDGALREGLLYDLLGRIRDDDVRGRSVAALANRYHVDRKHAGRVERTALGLLEQAAPNWKLDTREARQLLSWAAQLHEIGLDIAHAHYHKHGEYVVAHSDMLGFTREEQTALAALVRAHRRKFPATVIEVIPRKRARKIERLAVLLRLAVVLHRSRGPVEIPLPVLGCAKRSLEVGFNEDWLEQHPLTLADLNVEALYLKDIGLTLEID